MMTVRFHTGFSVQYNNANHAVRRDGYTDLYTRKDGTWLAQVPNTALIEVVTPCRTYMAQGREADRRIDELTREVRALKRRLPAPKPKRRAKP